MSTSNCKPLPNLSAKQIHNFWKKIVINGDDDCWPWTGRKNGGYGTFYFGKKPIMATRISMFLHSGIDPFPYFACHVCDVRYDPSDKSYRKCCNPKHLIAGTSADNQRHMAESGRSQKGDRHYRRIDPKKGPRGESSGHAKLTELEIRCIRMEYSSGAITQRALAFKFNVVQALISMIVRRKIWTHI